MSTPHPPRHKDEVTDLVTLETLAETLGKMSGAATGMPTTWRQEQVSLAFAKVAITCWTFLRILPQSSYYAPVKGLAVWDLSAAATQCRCLLEAYHVLVYLIHQPTSPEECDFQRLLWDFHREHERHEMLRAGVSDSRKLAGVAQTVTALRKAGISENYYRSNYKYCSSYAHTAPFSISQLRHFEAGDPEAENLMTTLVGFACAYSAMALRDFSALFPAEMLSLGAEVRKIIAIWEEVLRWEKSSYFGGPPS